MKTAGVMTGACLFTWLVMATLVTPDAAVELLLGMTAPLGVAVTTMILIDRTYRQDPNRLTPLMIKAFGTKIVLFGAYVAVVVSAAPIDPIPFVVSFTSYFIALHMIEALWLRSLFAAVRTPES